jgi:hypothetical protein
MRYLKNALLIVISIVLLASCAPQPSTFPTEVPTIEPTSPSTTTPQPSPTLTPTSTTEPSPTPLPIPAEVLDTFSDITLIHYDDFIYRGLKGVTPQGWLNNNDESENRRIRIIEGDIVKIDQPDASFGYIYSDKKIVPGTGIFLKFKYLGSKNIFTLGMDAVNDEGDIYSYRTEPYHSFAFYVQNQKRLVHAIEGQYIKTLKSEGDLKLVEDTWYNLILAITPEKQYVIQIWNPDQPEQRFTTTYTTDLSKEYYFIGWVDKGRTIYLDDFTLFNFKGMKIVE